ncbi:hypothetical protein [Gluconobacter thailandicus]|uniref:Uncharacterized protein n=1 Tax=Gluconobacter thailandicus TaxID=257438 RepID=A0AAP9ETY9_GLUTH|nr:hypothetical protein [Gluconobacter thailandicus]QEH97328.1 hypothetical protein FXF46_14500 [Gluconobacter thailandicus]
MACKDCKYCENGWLNRGDVECVNGVLIDIDVAHEGWQRDVSYPPGPCNACQKCGGSGYLDEDYAPCPDCKESGWNGGSDRSQALLNDWAGCAGDPA